ELVSSEAVGAAGGLDDLGELAAEPRQQRVAGEVTERVVVALEPVQVEEHEQARLRLEAVGEILREVLDELAPVAEPRQLVRDALGADALEDAPVLPEGEDSADEHGGEGRSREHGRERVQAVEVVGGEDADPDQPAGKGGGEMRLPLELRAPRAPAGGVPAGPAEKQHRGR